MNVRQIASSPVERESIGSGAAGGAALGAVLSLVVGSSAAVPVIGAILGAVGGAGAGHYANLLIQRHRQDHLGAPGPRRQSR